ncbi:MAG: hypothetical protein MUF34_32660 [Polyangiaceae bacterium]|jgi:hypothetical protein|nr:hypothetical protein [Polyangiaceae bacterium]
MPLSAPYGLFRFGFGPSLGAHVYPARLAPRDLSRGDYTRDETGALRAGTVNQQRVLIALSTPLGSMPSATDVGSIVPTLERDDGRLPLTVLRDTERALRRPLAEGAIALKGVDASVGPGGALDRVVDWVDLETGDDVRSEL